MSLGLRAGRHNALAPRLRILDPSSGAFVREAGLESSHPPPDGDQAAVPHFDGTWVWQPTRTAIHRVDPSTLASTQVLTHRLFHDVHSVAPGKRGWLITCTGHEAVVEMDLDGHVHHRWDLGPRLDDAMDGRQLPHDHFKPHSVHPNYAFVENGKRWVTSLAQGCCVGLDHEGRLELGSAHPHDGVLREGLRWFTLTSGRVLGLDPATGQVERDLDVAALESESGAFGWCRGVEVVGDRLWVGITCLRGSPWRETARRVVRGPRQPTRVVELNWRTGALVHRWPVAPEGSLYAITALV
ncbi:MAG: hypothetical protein AB8H79_24960 [Myxococcota bacterium]